ncbi:hypothetical protein AALP_AA1G279600 [Arabis alpina]|uniref:Uncharacterized protein n=1 Tax=Arabis alpina TaxID=50452 RepID=A0A087HR46_ARAAL|nr:hypothetical protein AALP_AA1G279600 [Arabis alpina]
MALAALAEHLAALAEHLAALAGPLARPLAVLAPSLAALAAARNASVGQPSTEVAEPEVERPEVEVEQPEDEVNVLELLGVEDAIVEAAAHINELTLEQKLAIVRNNQSAARAEKRRIKGLRYPSPLPPPVQLELNTRAFLKQEMERIERVKIDKERRQRPK